MTTSPAKTSSPTTTAEPLGRLLATLDEARALPEPEPYEQSGDDPLVEITAAIRAEAEHQAKTPPSTWSEAASETGAANGAQPSQPQSSSNTGSPSDKPLPESTGQDATVEARIGREVLALLRDQPLDGSARAAAVERLAGQLDDPDPDALREILGVLVTGQGG